MRYEKEKYERLIAESPLFGLDKGTQYTAFKREAYKMVEYLYCYLLAINEQKNEPYGCEITEVATRCINNFSSDKGDFLHYFNAAWKLEYQHIMGNQTQDDIYHGIRITEEEKRTVRKYVRLISAMDSGITTDELYLNLASAMGISVDKVKAIAQLAEVQVSGDTYTNDEGETGSIWDQIADPSYVDRHILEGESLAEILCAIERTYQGLQLRQRPIISDMITVKICEQLTQMQVDQYSFISKDVMYSWLENGTLPTQRDIAQKYGRDETSISRSVKDFINKLRKEVQKDGIK